MKKELKEKLKKGRQKYLENNYGLVCKIDDDIEIWADKYQYILKAGGNENNNSYFSSFDHIFDELLFTKEKELMLASKNKNMLSVKQSIDDAKKWLEEIVKPLFRYEIKRKS